MYVGKPAYFLFIHRRVLMRKFYIVASGDLSPYRKIGGLAYWDLTRDVRIFGKMLSRYCALRVSSLGFIIIVHKSSS